MQTGSPIDILIPLLAGPPDLSVLQDQSRWDEIKRQCGPYGVAPLIAHTARPHVAPPERLWCDRILADSWNRHERSIRNLEFVLDLLNGAGIPVISLKGPLLARRYYAPAFLRKPSLDLDLAVVEDDLERSTRILTQAGYQPVMPIDAARAQTHHLELTHPARPAVELHFRLSHRALGIPVDEFFSRAVPFPLPGGGNALVLSPADQLLHLVLHIAMSRFGTLFHLCEIRRICQAEPLSVRIEAIDRAAERHYAGVFRMLDTAMRLRFNEPFLPPEAAVPETWLNRRLTPRLYRQFEAFSAPGHGLSLASRIWARWLDFQLTDRPSDAFRSATFFLRTGRFYFRDARAWGTPRHLRFAPPVASFPLRNRRD